MNTDIKMCIAQSYGRRELSALTQSHIWREESSAITFNILELKEMYL